MTQTTNPNSVQIKAPQIQSRIQEIAARTKGWTEQEFIAECIRANICGVLVAKKIWGGDTRLRVVTLAGVASLFGVGLSDVVQIKVGDRWK